MIAPLLLAAATSAVLPSISLADLVEACDISSLAASPDGRLVAFRTERPSIGDNRIHLRWYVVPIDGSAPARAVADGGDVEINSGVVVSQRPVWSPSSRAVYFRAAIGGQVQVWRAPINGYGARRVTSEPSDVRTLSLGSDRRSLRFDIGAPRHAVAAAERDVRDHGVLIDGSVDVASALSDNDEVSGHPATMRFTGTWFARQPLLWDKNVRTHDLELGADDLAPARRSVPPVALRVRVEEAGDRQTLHATDAAGNDHICPMTVCPPAHIRSAVGLRDQKNVLVTTSDIEATQTLWLWTPVGDGWRMLIRGAGTFDGGHAIEDYPCAPGNGAIACIAEDASGPPHLVGVDTRSGKTWPLFDPNASLRTRELAARAILWTTPRGIALGGKLFLPRAPKPANGYPLVIDYYSCVGFVKGGLGDELPMVPLAEAGVATLCVNRARGTDKTHGWQEETAIDAVSSVIAQLDHAGLVDRTRIGMAGLSFGSEMVMTVLEQTKLLRAAAIASLQIEPYYYWINRIPGRDITPTLAHAFDIGAPDGDANGWKEHMPVGKVDAITAPLLMQLPESVMRQTMELYSRLAASQTPVEMIAYPNETHIKWKPRHKLAVYERNLDWFRFWLQGAEDPNPLKDEQYRRWRAFSARPGFERPVENHAAP